ncbi:MAG: M48 family metalloprotease [Candidatus Saccharibacteria bacterium]|nr:M48 family metalloprotease [Candidatus Saccharibacteria bacterium]
MNKQIKINKRNTIIILIGFTALIAAIGALISYFTGNWGVCITVLIIAAFYALLQYFVADKVAMSMTGSHKITKDENKRLYTAVEKMAEEANIPMPQVYIIDDSAPNAFATGRDPQHASVACTTGLLGIMDDKELTAVVGHEVSHIKNYDIRVSMITFGLVCIIGFIADIGLRMIYISDDRDNERSPVGFIVILLTSLLAPVAASIAQMAVSRQREYLADATSVKLTKNPDSMINALKKLDEHSRPMRRQNPATEAMYINNPLKKGSISSLFSTHPPIEKRITTLEQVKWNF